MPRYTDPPKPTAALAELVSQLLGCGAVLSQIVGRMVQFEASGRSAPDAASIPTVAHALIAGVLTELEQAHSRHDLMVAAAIVEEATDAVRENIFYVNVDALEKSRPDEPPGGMS